MSHFRATMRGNGLAVQTSGTKASGLGGEVNGWEIGVDVFISHDTTNDRDVVSLYLTSGSNNRFKSLRLGEFFLDENGNYMKCREGFDIKIMED